MVVEGTVTRVKDIPEKDDNSKDIGVSIVIVNWNTRDLLFRCVKSIVASTENLLKEVWVVDNASDDGSAHTISKKFPWVRLIRNDANIGFAQANNQAILQSHSRYVILLNPDTEVKTGAIDQLVAFMEKHPQAGAAGSRLIHSNGNLQMSSSPAPSLGRECWRLFHLDNLWAYSRYPMSSWQLDTHREVQVVSGACMIIRRAALDEVGLLDEDYFMYSEEVDLCERLRRADWRIYWVPSAQVLHHGAKSTAQIPGEMFLHLYGAKVLYFRKNHGRLPAAIYKSILFLAGITRILLVPLAWLEPRSKREIHWTAARYYGRLLVALHHL